MKTWIGLDIGHTSLNFSVIDEMGSQVRSIEVAINSQLSEPHQPNPSELLTQIMAHLDSLVSIETETPQALGLSGANRFVLLWDRNSSVPIGDPVKAPGRLLSYDAQSKLTEPTNAANNSQSATDFQRLIRTAQVNDSLILGSLESWLLSQLTGSTSPLTDPSCASRFYTLNQIQQMDKGVIPEEVGLKPTQHPNFTPSSNPSNTLGKIHLADGRELRVSSFLSSQSAQLLSHGCLLPGQGVLFLEPSARMLINTGSEVHDPDNTFIAWQLPEGETTYLSEITMPEIKDTLRWLFSNFNLGHSLTELHSLAKQVRSAEQVTLVPYRTTNTDKTQSTSLLLAGLSVSSNKFHIARAGLESIALQISSFITLWNKSNPVPLQSLSMGDVTDHLELLFQLISDLNHISVLCSRLPRTSAYGAALSTLPGLDSFISNYETTDEANYVPSAHPRAAASKLDKWLRFQDKLASFNK